MSQILKGLRRILWKKRTQKPVLLFLDVFFSLFPFIIFSFPHPTLPFFFFTGDMEDTPVAAKRKGVRFLFSFLFLHPSLSFDVYLNPPHLLPSFSLYTCLSPLSSFCLSSFSFSFPNYDLPFRPQEICLEFQRS